MAARCYTAGAALPLKETHPQTAPRSRLSRGGLAVAGGDPPGRLPPNKHGRLTRYSTEVKAPPADSIVTPLLLGLQQGMPGDSHNGRETRRPPAKASGKLVFTVAKENHKPNG
ncbi:hypothetical protein EYF80_066335 [Liparis tanakae]|uniref:Uncharacterized protein n=1 Tax=Liparis tanakae TaxID=230148 RepID=A0A4Z2E4C9_9TELE|nr:hypothetical protein EYF80_066335 [Liparis tanakae]